MDELWRLDATAQAALVRAGEVSPHELLEAAIRRIERLNPAVNAVVTPLFDEASAQIARGLPADAPFAGVPMLLKDASLEVAGTPNYMGLGVLRDIGHRSTQTTELASRLARAGFVFAGKTNVPAFSAGVTTEPPAFGPTRNPWDLARTPGGSSGGSAAAVAAGMVAVAHGADGTGSLRYPAACCGVVTLKPSRGRVPAATPGGMPDDAGVWAEFVLARSVRDLAGVLDAVGEPAEGEPAATAVERDPAPLRIGLLSRDVMTGGAIPTDAECSRAVEETGRMLASLGHAVDETHPPALERLFVRTVAAIQRIGAPARRAQIDWLAGVLGREPAPDECAGQYISKDDASRHTAAELAGAAALIDREMRAVLPWWETHDVLVTPACRQPAWPLGSEGGAMDAGVFPPPFSWTGQPAASLPLAQSAGGLPIGVQLVAAPGRDALLLQLAAQLERAASWADRSPAVAKGG